MVKFLFLIIIYFEGDIYFFKILEIILFFYLKFVFF